MNNLVRRYAGLLLILLASASCGDGGGVGGTGISSGTITGFGSVIVNGVEFNTTGATISVDDNPGSESDLAIGMVVTVRGTIHDDGTGTASSVTFEDNLEGPISSITPADKTLVVLGQTVVWDDFTICEDSGSSTINCASLSVNNLVEVSGFQTASGITLATRIEIKDQVFNPADEVELKGTISGLTDTTFLIGSQLINYSDAVIDDNVPNSTLADGMFVEVKGHLNAGVLEATKIELEDEELEVQENQEVELEGLVTFFDPLNPTNFEVNGQPVQTSANTVFENGSPDDLALNVRLEAEGTLNASGVLVASKIEFRHTRVRIEASVGAVDPANNTVTFFLTGSNSVVVTVNALTEMEDDNDAPLDLSNVIVDDWLEIRAHVVRDSSGAITEIIATEVERDELEVEVLLRGPVSSAADSVLTILGVTVNTSTASCFKSHDSESCNLTQEQFFAQVVANTTIVKAKGPWTGAQINAEELEIED